MVNMTLAPFARNTADSNPVWDALCEKGFLKVPNNAIKWKDEADEFERKWNFPNCLGAIDGKHVMSQVPPRSGSTFFNYKKFHSIVL